MGWDRECTTAFVVINVLSLTLSVSPLLVVTTFSVVPRLLAITPHYVMSFYPASTTPSGAAGDGGLATLKSRHKIAFLDKITSSKKIRNLLTFHWSLPGRAERKLEHYLVDQSRECIQIVKERFLANTPGKEDPDVNVK